MTGRSALETEEFETKSSRFQLSPVAFGLAVAPRAMKCRGSSCCARIRSGCIRAATASGSAARAANSVVGGPLRGSHLAQISKIDGSTTWIAGAGVGYQNGTGTQAWFSSITGITTDGTRLFIADGAANRLRTATAASPLPANESPYDNNAIPVPYGRAATLAGNTTTTTTTTAGVGTAASFAGPLGLTVIGSTGYVGGSDGISKVNLATGAVSMFAGQPGTPGDTDALTGSAAQLSAGALTTDGTYLYAANGTEIRRIDVTTGATSLLTESGVSGSLAFGADGYLYEGGAGTVRRFDAITGAYTTAWSPPVDGAGFIDDVVGIAADASGLWIAYSEAGLGSHDKSLSIAHVSYGGSTIATLPVSPNIAWSVGMVSAGDSVYVSWSSLNPDSSPAATVLYRIAKTGLITTVAGGSIVTSTDIDGVGVQAGFTQVHAMASDGVNLYTIDDHLLRAIVATPEPTFASVPTAAELIGGGDPSSLQQCPCKADPVQLGSGALIESGTDLSITGRGPGLTFTRSYDSSQAGSNGRLGYGWTDNLDMALTVDSGSGPTAGQVTIRQENGSQVTFAPDGTGNYTAPPRILATLKLNPDGSWTFTRQSRTRFTFDPNGRLTAIADLNGNATTLGYNPSGQLITATDPAGRQFSFGYTDSAHSGNITTVTDSSGRTVRYTYDTNGNLHTVTDVNGHVTTFGYNSSHQLTTLQDPRGNTTTSTYDPTSGKVTAQQDRRGHLTHIDYSTPNPAGYSTTTVTDQNGNETAYQYVGNLLTSVTKGAGTPQAATTSYTNDPTTLAQATVTDPNGHVSRSSYDLAGNLMSATDGLGTSSSYSYDNLGDVLTVTDPNGVLTTNSYDANGNQLTTSTPTGVGGAVRTITYHHDTPSHPGDVTSITDPLGKTTGYSFDSYGQLAATTDPLGNQTTLNYTCTPAGPGCRSNIGLAYSKTSPRGNAAGGNPAAYTTHYGYDDGGQLTKTTDPLGNPTSTAYDAGGNIVTVTDAALHVTTRNYDANNNLTSVVSPTAIGTATVAHAYDPANQLITTIGADGQTTSYSYDPRGRNSTIIDPIGNAAGASPATIAAHTTTLGYDAVGNLVSKSLPNPSGSGTLTSTQTFDAANELVAATDPNGHSTSYSYDADGRKLSVSDPNHHTTATSYDNLGNQLTVTDANNHTTSTSYDLDSQLLTATTPSGAKTSYGYDDAGHRTSVVDPRGNVTGAVPATYTTSYSYDADGNRLTATDPLTRLTRWTYDADGNTLTATDPKNNPTIWTYNPLGQMATIQGPDATSGQITSYSYDPAGNLVSRLDPNNHTTSWTYNASNQLTTAKDPLNRTTSYSYDPDGNPLSTVTPLEAANPGHGTVTNGYDSANRLTATSYNDGTPTASYSYDAAGQIVSHTGGAATDALSYDPAGQLTALVRTPVAGPAQSFGYGYDPAGNITSRTRPDGVTETLGYNADNQPNSLADASGSTTAGYDPAGEMTSLTQPSTPATQQTWTYDPAGQLTNIADTQGASTIKSYTLGYDQAGNLTTKTGPGTGTANTTSYSYDPANRLTQACPAATSCTGATTSQSYSYDPVGNRLTSASTSGGTTSTTTNSYDAADELTQAAPQVGSPTAYTYDANGNQLTAGTQTNTYGLNGLQTSATTPSGTVNYSYDPDGNRLTATQGTATTRYAWDPNTGNANLPDLVDETLPDATTRATDWLTPTLPTAITLTNGGSTTRDYLLTDPQHSIDTLISPAALVTGNYTYDAYGNLLASSGTDTALNQLRYGAGYLDPTTGQYDNRARTYDPTQGRFTTTDPLAPTLTGPYPSAYTYAGNNPLTHWDPTGLCSANPFSSNDCYSAAAEADYHVGKGVVKGGVDTVKGLANMALHPLQTIKALAAACGQGYYQYQGDSLSGILKCIDNINPAANIRREFVQAYNLWKNGCTNQAEETAGHGVFDTALYLSPLKLGAAGDIAEAPVTDIGGYVDVLRSGDRTHILDGDTTGGGGHRWPGAPGKMPFPQSWSDDQIIHNVGDIVTDPTTNWHVQTGNGGAYTSSGNPAVWRAWEVRDGVRIRVAYEPATGRVRTAFPDNGPTSGARIP
jgi:RHS repeat-associated protein